MTITEIKTTISKQHLKHKIKKLNKVLKTYYSQFKSINSTKVSLEEDYFKIHYQRTNKGYSRFVVKIPVTDIDLVIDRYKRKVKYKTK